MIRGEARRRVAPFLMGIAATGALLVGYMVMLASSPPIVRRLVMPLKDWPAAAPALRIAFISDTHLSIPGDTPTRLTATVARVNALRPDIVLLGGDFIAEGIVAARAFDPAVSIATLRGLHPRLATLAVMGNHDYPAYAAVRAALTAAHIPVLENEARRVGPLTIIGVGDEFSHHARVAQAVAAGRRLGGPFLAFTHSPDAIPKLPPDVTLVLAGHTHCGQVSVPLLGPPIMPSRYGQHFLCGIVRDGARTSVISAGLGTSGLPIRFGAPPDVWLITLGLSGR